MSIKTFLLFVFILHNPSHALAAQPIRVLNWWDYLADSARNQIASAGYDISEIVYKSNESALARLSTKHSDFDVAIVSSAIAPLLTESGVVTSTPLTFVAERKLEPWLKQMPHCSPYLWSATIFTYDSSSVNSPPETLGQLTALKAKGVEIGIVDDALEFAYRLAHDPDSSCAKLCKDVGLSCVKRCLLSNHLSPPKSLSSEFFRSDLLAFSQKANDIAAYGCELST